MDYLKGLNWRYAVKKMSGESPDENKINTLLESIRLTASSYGLQPYRLIVVRNSDLKRQLQEASFNQEKVSAASHMLVFATVNAINNDFIKRFIALTAKQRRIPLESLEGLERMISKKVSKLNKQDLLTQWAKNQTYIALGSALAAAASLGIDTCPMEGFEADKYDEILGLEKLGLKTAVVAAVGIRSNDDKHQYDPKVRWEPEEFYIHL